MKVLPKNDMLRKVLRHPVAGGFRSEGSANWPRDTFTKRRIRDGDVTVVGEDKKSTPSRPVARKPDATV